MMVMGGVLKLTGSTVKMAEMTIMAPNWCARATEILLAAMGECLPKSVMDTVHRALWEDVWGAIGAAHAERLEALANGGEDTLDIVARAMTEMEQAEKEALDERFSGAN